MDYDVWFTSTHHSVGQGLMHSGILRSSDDVLLTTVYDCGSTTGSQQEREQRLAGEIRHLKRRTSEIDVLYLSHFDEDHVNGLPQLFKEFQPRTIVIPSIPASERLLRLTKSHGATGLDSVSAVTWDLVRDPLQALHGMTGHDSNIVVVQETPPVGEISPEIHDASANEVEEELTPVFVSPSQDTRGAGAVLGGKTSILWIAQPWVRPEVSNIAVAFAKILGFADEQDLEKNLPSLLSSGPNVHKHIQNAYASALARVKKSDVQNFTTLCLYLGPPAGCQFRTYRTRNVPCPTGQEEWAERADVGAWDLAPGWLGTGDATLGPDYAAVLFNQAFAQVTESIGQATLPHHGSQNNMNTRIWDAFPTASPPTWVASAGSSNRYRYPSRSVLQDASTRGAHVVLVNENDASRFSQVVHVRLSF